MQRFLYVRIAHIKGKYALLRDFSFWRYDLRMIIILYDRLKMYTFMEFVHRYLKLIYGK